METKAERGLQIVANFATVIDALRGITYVMIIVAVPVALVKVMPVLDRLVTVVENLDRKTDEIYESLRPVGKEAIAKGIETIKSVDGKTVGKSITDAIRKKLKSGDER